MNATALAEGRRLLEELCAAKSGWVYSFEYVKDLPITKSILSATPEVGAGFVIAVLETVARTAAADDGDPGTYSLQNLRGHDGFPTAGVHLVTVLLRRRLPFDLADTEQLIQRAADMRLASTFNAPYLPALVSLLEKTANGKPLPAGLAHAATRLAEALAPVAQAAERKLLARVQRLLDEPRQLPLDSIDRWAEQAANDIEQGERERAIWMDILTHAITATGGSPSGKWRSAAADLLKKLRFSNFRKRACDWFAAVDEPRTTLPDTRTLDWRWTPQGPWAMSDANATVLKGLVWFCASREDEQIARALVSLTLSAYRKLPGIGPRLVSIGNACVWALGNMPGSAGIGPLAMLKVRVKFGTAQKMIEKALDATAARVGIPRAEIEEMSVPAYGLTEVGRRRETLGEYTAELVIRGPSTVEMRWFKPDGKPLKSAPAAVKKDHADDLKELAQASKDIQKMLPAQRERLDQLFLAQKSWPLRVWRERYLDHPLVGVLARRLIWSFTRGDRQADAIWLDRALVGPDDRALDWLDDSTAVSLWHPAGRPVEHIVAWRNWLERHELQQPFKQAHREIYLLTDAERRTHTYSNRYASHILRQHQFNALCAARGWKNKLRLLVDAEYPPATRPLPNWNLRAEFWIEGIGEYAAGDVNDSGVYHRISTDQVRFYRIDANQMTAHAGGGGYHAGHQQQAGEGLPLDRVPPLVFSEIMRDVDLFVGVASVGNDPTWQDGGPEGRYVDYWNRYAWGELAETAQTRKAVLEKLVPRLHIAGRCTFDDKFLVVRGDLRTYKIHLGSGNILMTPNDQYLCIVQGRGAAAGDTTGKLFLPFEGDERLAVILSKALLLAEDKKISDPSITRQIRPD